LDWAKYIDHICAKRQMQAVHTILKPRAVSSPALAERAGQVNSSINAAQQQFDIARTLMFRTVIARTRVT
jgi:hypothetical protein